METPSQLSKLSDFRLEVKEASTAKCVSPKSVAGKETQRVADMFGSHDWKVDDSKPFGNDGVLIHFKCARCDADGMATINEG